MPHVEDERKTAKGRAHFRLASPAFEDGAPIPTRYTADGDDRSPPLSWDRPPNATNSLALLCEDPDAPGGTFVHWVLWDIEAKQRELPEGIAATGDPSGVGQGQNDFGDTGYGGPKPPPGKPHRYRFRLFALDRRAELEPGASRAALERAMRGHVLAEGVLTGTYRR